MTTTNPLEAIWSLLFKEGEADTYKADPDGYLRDTGLDQCDAGEINELVTLAYEKGPVSQGATVSGASTGPAPQAPPPPPLDPSLPASQAIQQTVNYYVDQSTHVDDRDTYVDSSINTQVNAGHGSDIDLDFTNETTTASGDGAVAAGGDIEDSVVNTGSIEDSVVAGRDVSGNTIGDGNISIGDDNNLDNVAFGDGNTQVQDDSFTDNSVHDSFNTDNSINDSFNTDNSFTDNSVDNSVDFDDSFNREVEVNDSFNDNSVTETTTDVDVDVDLVD